MTTLDYTHSAPAADRGLVARLAVFVETARDAHARRVVRRDTLRELSALSDRSLADLGLHRSMLRRVAEEAATR